MTKEEKVQEILKRLYVLWPHPETELKHSNPLELLVAVMLSAQATDKHVNTVTPALFERFKTAEDYANASWEEIDEYVKRVNFHRNKAKNIHAMGRMLVERFGGQVPRTMEELDSLPGVARKTANVVLGNAFGKREGIAVDTHVIRLTKQLGLTTHDDPVKIEQDLMAIVPRAKWTDFSHLLILFGRYYCPARKLVKDGTLLADLVD